jgi:NADH:ubiquinone oxidoreductase subunit E
MLENTVLQLQEDERFKKLLDRTEKAEKQTKEYRQVTKEIIKQFNLNKKDVIEIIDKVQERKGRER